MRIYGDVLDPSDSYASDWVGSKNGGRETLLAGTELPWSAFLVKLNPQQSLGGLGLVLASSVSESRGSFVDSGRFTIGRGGTYRSC